MSTKKLSKAEPDYLLSEEQAGDQLGVSKFTIRRLRHEGELAYVTVRHSIRIPTSEVAAYISRQTEAVRHEQ